MTLHLRPSSYMRKNSPNISISVHWDMQHGLESAACTWICSMDMFLDMQHVLVHVYVAWTGTCSMDLDVQHEHELGHAACT